MTESDPVEIPRLPARADDSHKGSYGKVLVVGGSLGFTGAACLAGTAALRAGAGLVTIGVPRDLAAVIPAAQPCAMSLPLPEIDGRLIAGAAAPVLDFLAGCDALVLGPGLGWTPATTALVEQIIPALPCPAVVDADALNALSDRSDVVRRAGAPLILTPHPGEMKRLDPTGAGAAEDRDAYARRIASDFGCVLVLKGHRTIVSDGRRSYRNSTGNPGMATGGTGDVLSGVIGALVGQGLAPLDAAVLGVHVHGLAGDLAADRHGQVSMIATDLLDTLGDAFRRAHDDPVSGYER